MNDERRLAILLVTPELLLQWCKPGKQVIEVIQNGLPEDARMFAAGTSRPTYEFDADTACFKIIFTSESLRPIPPGDRIPVWPAPVFQRDQTEQTVNGPVVPTCPNCGFKMLLFAEMSTSAVDLYRCVDCAINQEVEKEASV